MVTKEGLGPKWKDFKEWGFSKKKWRSEGNEIEYDVQLSLFPLIFNFSSIWQRKLTTSYMAFHFDNSHDVSKLVAISFFSHYSSLSFPSTENVSIEQYVKSVGSLQRVMSCEVFFALFLTRITSCHHITVVVVATTTTNPT